MPDDAFNLREETTFRTSLFKRMDDQDKVLDEINGDVKLTKAQAYKTNGRVSKLEWWRNAVIWGVGLLLALAVPILNFIKSEIRTTVVGVLSDYDVVSNQVKN